MDKIILFLIITLILIYISKKCKKTEKFEPGNCAADGRSCSQRARCEATDADIKHALEYANKTMCESRGYTYTLLDDGSYTCTHTKQTCERDSADPIKNMYLEWNDSLNKCVFGMEEFKKFCLGKKLTYNKNTGKCSITPDTCKSFGADFTNGDCEIPGGQKFGESVFGQTSVRAIKNGFSCT